MPKKNKNPLSDKWATPNELFQWASDLYGPFDLDAAADSNNNRVSKYFDLEADSLKQSWNLGLGRVTKVWLNPPYSTPYPWLKKASDEAAKGSMVVCLVKADHTTKWWKDFIYDYTTQTPHRRVEIIPIPYRVKFIAPPGMLNKHGKPIKTCTCNFPSSLVIFRPR